MPEVAIVILAAGESKRMGRPKQLVQIVGESLLNRAIRTALESKIGEVHVVLGSGVQELASLVPSSVQIIMNSNWQEGIASSIRMAVSANKEMDAILFMSCDQPFIDSSLLRKIYTAFQTESREVVAALYGTPESPGIPALFANSKFEELLRLTGDRGAKKIIVENDAFLISAPEADFDIDTEEDLARTKMCVGARAVRP